jgi:uncharacterized protein (TIGR03435 family)
MKKLFWTVAAMAAVAAPRGGAQPPAYEVVSIKPNHTAARGVMIRMAPGGRFVAENVTVKFILQEAYNVKDSQISGAPGWLDSEHYDIEAKMDEAEAAADSKLGSDAAMARQRLMLQSMLVDRFKLALHHDAKEMSVYALVVAKSGSKLHAAAAAAAAAGDAPPMRRGIMMRGRGDLNVTGANMEMFCNVLARQIDHLVVDQTGLKGEYDFALKWTPEAGEGQMFRGAGGPPGDGAPPPEASGPSIFTALQEQLGLKLEAQKGPVDTIVIDHVERPSEN